MSVGKNPVFWNIPIKFDFASNLIKLEFEVSSCYYFGKSDIIIMNLIRFGVSIPGKLSRQFDAYLRKKKYKSRSEGIRDLIRQALIQEEIEENVEVVAVTSLLYDHHKRELSEQLLELQHAKNHIVLSSTHIHLDHDNCIEVIIMSGLSQDVKELADVMIAAKGVKHGTIEMSSTGKNLE